MELKTMLERMEYQVIQGEIQKEITTLVYDSRKVEQGCVFVCMKGVKSDGHEYINEVIKQGAAAIVAEREITVPDNITVILVKNTRLALAMLSAAYFDYPAEKLITIGITGTKGKTTTAYMVYSILNKANIKTGLIGTIETIIGNQVIHAVNTTPESYLIQEYFSKMVKASLTCVVMEVSSQGLMLNRIAGFMFDYGVFTNIEPDHISPEEHKDFEEYMYCKSLLFSRCKTGILNIDDPHVAEILKGHTCRVETFGTKQEAELRAVHLDLHTNEGMLGVSYDVTGMMNFRAKVNIPGKFNVYNSLTAIAICRHFDVPVPVIQKALSTVQVKGRVELVNISERFTLMIDYAHNAMSLNSLLTTIKEYNPKRLVCVFGCGGNRAKDRRFEMGEISSKLADFTIVTSDNPRFEEPQAIIDDIIVGVKRGGGAYTAIIDRKEAIRYCIKEAKDGDVIILAGKGHEDYQEIKGVKYHMDERELIYEVISEMSQKEREENGIYLPKQKN